MTSGYQPPAGIEEPPLRDILLKSTFPTPELPTLSHETLWNAVFTHQSLPDNNLVLAVLGGDVFRTCVTDWLVDADPLVTPDELEARTSERLDDELLCALSDVYALPSQLRYARFVPLDDRFTPGDTVHVFYAYIGAVYREKGFEAVKGWIYELLEWDNETMLRSLRD